MAAILTIGTFTYDNIQTQFQLSWTDIVEGNRHRLAYTITTIQYPTSSGYVRNLRSGALNVSGQVINIPARSVTNGTVISSGNIYTTNESVSVSLSCNVGGETKSGSTTVRLQPISKASVYENGQFVNVTPKVFDGSFQNVKALVFKNGAWEEL